MFLFYFVLFSLCLLLAQYPASALHSNTQNLSQQKCYHKENNLQSERAKMKSLRQMLYFCWLTCSTVQTGITEIFSRHSHLG